MLTIISSAKTLNFEPIAFKGELTSPTFPKITNQLLAIVKNYSEAQLSKTMGISEKLAHLNKERFQNFEKQDSKAAIFAYAGDVFNNIQSENLSEDAVNFLNRICLSYQGYMEL